MHIVAFVIILIWNKWFACLITVGHWRTQKIQ